MRDSEISSLLNGVRDAVIVADASTGVIVYWNPAASEVFGYSPAEALGMHLEELVPDLTMARQRAETSGYRERGHGRYMESGAMLDLTAVPKDGNEIGVELTLSPIELGEGAQGEYVLAIVRDVTERNRAEESSQESHVLLHSIIEGTAEAIFLKDSQGRYVIVNSSCIEIVGKPAEEIVGKKDADLYPPEVADALVEVDRRVMDTGETITREESLPVAGETRTYLSTKTPYRDHWGNIAGVIGVSTDITERKMTEKKLREAEQRYRTLVEQIPAITYVQEPDEPSRTTYISPQYETVLGYSREESLGDPGHWIKIMHPADQERVLAEDRRTNETGEPFSMEFRQLAKDGRVVWIRDEATLVRDEEGSPSYWLGIQTDITEHKRAEERLQEAEARYRSLVEEVPGVIYIQEIEPDGIISYISPQIEEIMGYSPQEYMDDPNLWVRAIHPEDRERVLAEEQRTDETGEPFRVEYRKITRDGRVIWVRDVAVLVKTPEGRPMYWQGIFADVTEHKRAEEALKMSEERYRLLVENSPDTIAVLGEDKITFINAAGAKSAGAEGPEDMIGRPYLDFVHPDFREIVKSRVSRAQREGVTAEQLEEKLLRLDGSVVDVEAIVIPITDGDKAAALSVVRDITERKRTEKEIEKRARQQAIVAELGYRALAETSLQTLMDEIASVVAQTLDVEYCKILELLPEGDELLLRAGVGWEEGLVGRATEGTGLDSQAGFTLLSEEPVILDDLHEEERFSSSTLLRDHGVASGVTVIILNREQPFGILGAHTRSRRDFTGDDINFLQAVANVLAAAVERMEVEETLGKVRADERTRLARDLHDEALQDLTRALTETQLIQRISEDPKLSRRLERVSEALKQAGQGMHAAINDLRLEAEGQEQTLAEMLESLVELTRQGSPDCEIDLSVDDGLSTLSGARQVEVLRILREALTNALRHSDADHIWITVATSEGKLWAEVDDDGRGFDPTQPVAGMGLKGMRERARALGGDLEVESEPGEGTKVRFDLVYKRAQEKHEEARILLVDDHASVRQAMASVFEQEPGFVVVGQAGSLSEARQILETSQEVDVAIIDLRLPDGYGGELIRELRAHHPRAQALVLSAILGRADMARAVEYGAAGVLHKMAGMDEVVEAVKRLNAGEMLLPLEEVVELFRFAGSRREEEYEARKAIERLTSRERELLQALAEGLDSKEIAERLHISVKTEANHVTSILNKLGVHSRLQALVFAVRYGVVEIK